MENEKIIKIPQQKQTHDELPQWHKDMQLEIERMTGEIYHLLMKYMSTEVVENRVNQHSPLIALAHVQVRVLEAVHQSKAIVKRTKEHVEMILDYSRVIEKQIKEQRKTKS